MSTTNVAAARAACGRPPSTGVSFRALALVVAWVIAGAGCGALKQTAEMPGKAVALVKTGGQQKAVDPMELQQATLRLNDEYLVQMLVGVDRLQRGGRPLDPAEVLQWKISLASQTTSIASGPNAIGNLLDLTAFVSVTRAALEEQSRLGTFGDTAQGMLETSRRSETNLWRATGRILSRDQQAEMRAALAAWRRENPQLEAVVSARAVSFSLRTARTTDSEGERPGSVFSLLMIDPLSGLDPAAREIAQTRLFAERALYVAQRMPLLIRWQTELLALNATRLPAVQQAVTNAAVVAASADGLARVAGELPTLVDRQREAAIRQVFEGLAVERTNLIANLAAEEAKLRGSLSELRQVLAAGGDMARSVDGAIRSLDAFMGRFDAGTNAAPPSTNSRPFDILDYATAAREIAATARELNATVSTLDRSMPKVEQAGATFEAAGQRLLGRLFLVGAGLILILTAGLAGLAIVRARASRGGRGPSA